MIRLQVPSQPKLAHYPEFTNTDVVDRVARRPAPNSFLERLSNEISSQGIDLYLDEPPSSPQPIIPSTKRKLAPDSYKNNVPKRATVTVVDPQPKRVKPNSPKAHSRNMATSKGKPPVRRTAYKSVEVPAKTGLDPDKTLVNSSSPFYYSPLGESTSSGSSYETDENVSDLDTSLGASENESSSEYANGVWKIFPVVGRVCTLTLLPCIQSNFSSYSTKRYGLKRIQLIHCLKHSTLRHRAR